MKKKFRAIIKVLKNTCLKVLEWIEKEEWSIAFVGGVVVLLMLSVSGLEMLPKMVLIVLIMFMYYIGMVVFLEIKQDENTLPKLSKRLTLKDSDGNICLREEDVEEAIFYLYELENYIHKTGDKLEG